MNRIVAILALAAIAAVATGVGAVAQEEPATETTANVEVRVWQDVRDALRIYISARPEDGSWATLGTIPLPLDDGHSSNGRFRYGNIVVAVPVASTTKDVEVRVWQNVNNARSIYISARPEGGSWATLGTIPLPLDDGHSSSGRFRYGDITVEVPVPLPPPPEGVVVLMLRDDDGIRAMALSERDADNPHLRRVVESAPLVAFPDGERTSWATDVPVRLDGGQTARIAMTASHTDQGWYVCASNADVADAMDDPNSRCGILGGVGLSVGQEVASTWEYELAAPSPVCAFVDSIEDTRGAVYKVCSSLGCGTAFHIGGGRFITVAHLSAAEESVRLTPPPGASEPVSGAIVWRNPDFSRDKSANEGIPADFAVIESDHVPQQSISLSARTALDGEGLAVIGYPGAGAQQTAYAHIIWPDDRFIVYREDSDDTLGLGFSGGPAIDVCGAARAIYSAELSGGDFPGAFAGPTATTISQHIPR